MDDFAHMSDEELEDLRVQRVEQGGPGDFGHMSDEELEAYVYGDRGLEH